MLSKILKEDGAKRTLKTMAICIGKPVRGDRKLLVFCRQGIITLVHVLQGFL